MAGLQTPDGPSTSSGKQDVETEYYDDIYFDSSSGSDEGGGAGEGVKKRKERKRGKVRKLTNDELFYDPHMDEEDEKWVARQRMAYHNGKECPIHICTNFVDVVSCAFFAITQSTLALSQASIRHTLAHSQVYPPSYN